MTNQVTTGLSAVEALRRCKEAPGTYARRKGDKLFTYVFDKRDGLWYSRVIHSQTRKVLDERTLPTIPIAAALEPWEHHSTADTL